ncbi:hypothetical protein [uncultured Methanomethylovorans sp.]|jgi:hypothetical protein|uniref:hypothetical protein n=1 Tax=uncultured Methanomethylovorans sp. TaxID=183759 RepID=UPI002AA8AAAD|nr:hypothetical protein [uncultured Methanomethylovorans sp.]
MSSRDHDINFSNSITTCLGRNGTGKRSEKKIPTGKLFGLKKFDLVKIVKGIGFIKGKRSTGYFAICDIFNNTISNSVKVKSECIRLQARKTTLVQIQIAIPPPVETGGLLAPT